MLRVAILGAGSMGHTHAAGWAATDAKVVGVVALDRGAAEEVAALCGAAVYQGLDAVLPQVDIVDICLPTYLHLEFTLKAAAAGKHIFCEKPIARTVEDGQKMIAACNAAGVRLFVGQVIRFFPQYRKAYDALQDGKIGNLAVLRLTRVGYRPHSSFENWFGDVNRSGGPLLDVLVHDYDYARWMGGEIERVYTRCSPPDAGSTAPVTTYFKAAPGAVADVGIPLSPLEVDPYTAIIQHFYDAVQHDKPFAVTPEDALAAVQIGIAALESAATGKPVTLTPLPEVN